MEWSDALLGQNVGLSSVLQQHCGDFHLVLLGRDVEGSVAVLMHGDSEGEKMVSLLDVDFDRALLTSYAKRVFFRN